MEANFAPTDFVLEPQVPRFLLELKGGLAQLSAFLQCAYGTRIMTLGVTSSAETVWLPDPNVPTRYSTRDTTAERAALAPPQLAGDQLTAAGTQDDCKDGNAGMRAHRPDYDPIERGGGIRLCMPTGHDVTSTMGRFASSLRSRNG